MARRRKQIIVTKKPDELYQRIYQWFGLQDYDVVLARTNEMIEGKKNVLKYLRVFFSPTPEGTMVTVEMYKKYSAQVGPTIMRDANMLISFISSLSPPPAQASTSTI